MTLRSAHIGLITAAIFMVVVILAFGIHRYTTEDDTSGLVLAGAGAVVGIGLFLYLRHFIRKPRK